MAFGASLPAPAPRRALWCRGRIPTFSAVVSPACGGKLPASVNPLMALTARLARASALHLDTPPTDVTAKTTYGEVPQRDTLMRSVTPLAVLILAFAATATGCGDAFSPEVSRTAGGPGVFRPGPSHIRAVR